MFSLDSTFESLNSACPDISGPVQYLGGESFSFAVNNPTRENEATQFAVSGPPGTLVAVRYSLHSDSTFRPQHAGVNLLGPPRFPGFVGVIGPDGNLHWTENLGLLPPGYDILRSYAQIVGVVPALPVVLSGKSTARPHPPRTVFGPGVALSRLNDDL